MSEIYQMGSYATLYGGFYNGVIRIQEVLAHGSMGIGTLDGADGEVIILDGIAYHGNAQNQVRIIAPDETLPYVAVISPTTDITFDGHEGSSRKLLSNVIDKLPIKSLAYSVKISGTFASVEISSKPNKNGTTAYPDILAAQPHFIRENIAGTIIGLWSPPHLAALYGNGFHLHFISADYTFGAHLVNFIAQSVTVELAPIDKMRQEFPISNENFQKMVF